MSTYWISFTCEGESLGACIVDADDYADHATIAQKAIDLGCFSGRGEIQVRKIYSEDVPKSFRNRLLTPDEADAFIAGKVN
jgi:hypothetical protein